jgi:uncharacterized membrane protein
MIAEETPARADNDFGPVWRLGGADALALVVLIMAAAIMVIESSAMSLTFDELLSWVTATLATPQLIWRSLALAPLPLDPPLYHWIDHYVIKVLGDSELAVRLPSVAGMLAALWLIYVFTRRAAGRTAGLLAMTMVIASGAFRYGYNARPYGVVLAAAAGALVSWQNIVRGRSRLPSVVCFGACLAIADSLHYYSVLIFLPFAAGELVRAYRARQVDWPVLFAIICGNAVVLAFLPLIPATRAYQGTYWRGVASGDLLNAYRMLLNSLSRGALLLAVPVTAYVVKSALSCARGRKRVSIFHGGLRTEETATLVSFALYPFIVLALSLTATHTFSERFALPAILGLSILPALAMRVLVKWDGALLLTATLVLCFAPLHAIQSVRNARDVQRRYATRYAVALSKETAIFNLLPERSRVVISDPVLYLRTLKYSPESVRRRILLLDLVESPDSTGRKDTGEMVVLGVRVGIGKPVITLRELNELRDPFFLVCCRTFEKLDDRMGMVLQDSRNIRATTSGTFSYWPVYVMQPVRLATDAQ